MTPEQVKEHFQAATQTDLATILGKPISTVSEWFQLGRVPRAAQLELHILTNGKLQAEPRHIGRLGRIGSGTAAA
jgi:DNA-binding transcriptional regulator YiaG